VLTATAGYAVNTEDRTVILSVHRRHRTIECKKFLQKIDGLVPAELDVQPGL
jgi:hypothetical protein